MSGSLRTVVVTGAGSGIGRAIAHRLLGDGYRCVIAGRREASLDETIELAASSAGSAVPVVCDIRRPEDRDRLLERAAEQPSPLYALVNNAGISRLRPLLDQTLEDWHDVLRTNLEAAFFLAQGAVELMRPKGEGRIVNVASVYGTIALDNRNYPTRAPATSPGDRGPVRETAYAASKGGLLQLTRELAAAVGHWSITVNSVSPGAVPLPVHDLPEAALASMASLSPLGRAGTPEDIAGPVSFLLSEDAGYVHGIDLRVDGGWTIW